jgi:glutaredoxin-like YruB-family protein
MEKLQSYSEFIQWNKGLKRSFLLLYKSGSAVSDCAFNGLHEAVNQLTASYSIALADVNTVRDIHTHFDINSVPSFLIFAEGKHINTLKGCHTSEGFKNILENSVFQADTTSTGGKNVTVYTTPTCSWCNTLKTWLRKNQIRFTEVDVSADQRAAQELVRRSGQQGVPQTDINGEIVVGFNQARLKELLGVA